MSKIKLTVVQKQIFSQLKEGACFYYDEAPKTFDKLLLWNYAEVLKGGKMQLTESGKNYQL